MIYLYIHFFASLPPPSLPLLPLLVFLDWCPKGLVVKFLQHSSAAVVTKNIMGNKRSFFYMSSSPAPTVFAVYHHHR